METETTLQAILTAWTKNSGGPHHPDPFQLHFQFLSVQKHHGVTYVVTDNYLHLIILKSLPKEGHKPHLPNIQYMYRHISLKHMCDLMPTSVCDEYSS